MTNYYVRSLNQPIKWHQPTKSWLLTGLHTTLLLQPSTISRQEKPIKMLLLWLSALIVAAHCRSALLCGKATNVSPKKLTRKRGVELINRIDRSAQHGITLPPPGFPALQTNFTVPLGCGEDSYHGTGRLQGLNVLVTSGDSGID